MERLHYVTNKGVATISVDSSQLCLVAVPGTRDFYVTLTYASQVLPKHRVIMNLGDSCRLAETILPDVSSRLKAIVGEVEVSEDSTTRAKILSEYCDRKGIKLRTNIGATLNSDQELKSQQINILAVAVYGRLSSEGADASIKQALLDYLRHGRTNKAALSFFATHIDPVFGKYAPDYRLIESELEAAVTEAINQVKTVTGTGEEIMLGDIRDIRPMVYDSLQELTGARPKRHFTSTIDQVVQGENDKGLWVPFNPGIGKQTLIPLELEPNYMPVEKLGQIITLFHRVIADLLIAYTKESEQILQASEHLRSQGKEVRDRVLMQALFPEDHMPAQTLYSREGQGGLNEPEVASLHALVKEERSRIPSAARKYFGIPPEEARFDELVSLQAKLMQLLPLPTYVCANIDARFKISMSELKMNQNRLKKGNRELLRAYEANERRLLDDFGIRFDEIRNWTQGTVDEAIRLFGPQFEFIRRVKTEALE